MPDTQTSSAEADALDPAIVIPGQPSDEAFLKQIDARDPLLIPKGASPHVPDSASYHGALAKLSPERRELAIKGRFLVSRSVGGDDNGPGVFANALDRKRAEQYRKGSQAAARIASLTEEHNQVTGYDHEGNPIYVHSQDRREQIAREVASLRSRIEDLNGPHGAKELAEARLTALAEEKLRWRQQYIEAQAEKLAEKMTLEEAIESRAAQKVKALGNRNQLSEKQQSVTVANYHP